MKKTTLSIIIFLVLFVGQVPAQTKPNISIFNRLLIFNAKNEVLIVRVKSTKDWLTPGFYQDNKVLLKEGLNNVAKVFGLTISKPRLQGVFVMKRREDNHTGYRNFFVATTKDIVPKLPSVVDKYKWIRVGKVNRLTTFSHTDKFIRQVALYPDTVWGGALETYIEDGKPKARILENFYPLFNSKKNKSE